MKDFITLVNSKVGAFAWGPWTVALIAITGIFLMVGLRCIPLRKLGYGFKLLFEPVDQRGEGEISPFQALMTSLAATIGTGNIAGVSTAIAVGGPGAIFWMWLIAIFGIATKYAEAVLAVHFRETDAEGNHVGGPMYYIRNGLGHGWTWMAGLFALFGMLAGFGIGNGVQAFELAKALEKTTQIPRSATGVVLGVLIFLVVIGGVRRIARAASAIVPVMAILYIGACLVILSMHINQIPSAFGLIFSSAFSGQAAVGGVFGAVVLQGLKRGIFSNEAGLGSAPIAHAASKTTSAVRQGSVAMLGTFIDTFVVCTMTALVVITNYSETLLGMTDKARKALSGSDISITAFGLGINGGGLIVTAGIVVFAFTTILGWSFYGEKCTQFLFGEKAILPYRLVWIAVAVCAAIAGEKGLVWNVSDTLNGLMALPNLLALLLLSGTVFKLTRAHRFSEG
ncbi:sodium:alanine symporter family protein [Synechococcus sp. UW140]|uniref:alanine/glycine:cation symporter family protein n=1 Tax=Synechococcus sp. UW140 TaxID=368503 RepID=UPI000E0EC86A|nr:alanine/glycine:cation symporter family protein [Synechococcus sp. UW140]